MAAFTAVSSMILEVEGGYVNTPDDSGGETKYGISKSSYPNLNIKSLTEAQALEIYKKDFWDKLRLSEIDYQSLANKIMLFGIHAGCPESATLLQRSLISYGLKVKVDGVLGSKTIAAANAAMRGGWLINLYTAEVIEFYCSLVIKSPSKRKFLSGWIKRALR